MDINTIYTLTYSGVAVVVAIISATITGNVFRGMLFGVSWPLTIVACVVYLASDFLYGKFCK